MADGCGEQAGGQKTQNWGYYVANFLVEIWADKEIQRQPSALGRKHNIWENIAAKFNNNGYKRAASQCKTKFTTWNKSRKKRKNLD